MKTEHRIYAAVAVLALAGGGLYLTRQKNAKVLAEHQAAKPADLPAIAVSKDETDKITKIQVSSPNKDDKTKKTDVTLEKSGEEWTVTSPVTAKANAANVRSLLDNLKDLKTKEVIDRGTGSYDQYELSDGKAVHVVAFKGADKVVDLYFGKSGSRGQMVRVAGKDGAYGVSGYSSYLYTREVKNWRETTILKFEDANAIQVDVTNKNGLFSFSKNGDKWSASQTVRDKEGKLEKKPEKEWKKFDEAKVKDLLRAYKALNAEDFGEPKDTAESGLDKADQNGGVVHIKLKDSAGDITVKVGKVSKGTSRWAMKEGNETLYSISSWTADWATANASKFEKSDDKNKKDKDKAPAPAPEEMPEE
jgi:hypothetical protein